MIRMTAVILLILSVAVMLSACEKVDGQAIEAMSAQLAQAEALHDAGDALGAAKAFRSMKEQFVEAQSKMNHKTAKALRERVLLPLYQWLGLTDGSSTIIGSPLWWQEINDGSYERKRNDDERTSYILYATEETLELLYRNSLYDRYRHVADEGGDIYTLEELPYAHDKGWSELSQTFYRKYQYPLNGTGSVPYKGGNKLLIRDQEKTGTWSRAILQHVSTPDLAKDLDEARFVIHIEEDLVALNARWVDSRTGNTVKNYYRSDVTLTLEDLATGETQVLCKGSASPKVIPGVTNFNSSNVGRHDGRDVAATLEQEALPILGKYMHVF